MARTFTLYGKDFPLVVPPEFDLRELVDCENQFGAMFDTNTIDARKLASILYVSVRRVDKTVSPTEILELGPKELEEVQKAVEAWANEDDPVPLGTSAETESEPSFSAPSSSDEPATESEASTPPDTGSRSSATSVDSDPLTLIA